MLDKMINFNLGK